MLEMQRLVLVMTLLMVFEALFGCAVAYGETFDDKLSISARQNRAIMKKATALESQIQQHQQQQAVRTEDTKEYQAGFADGYNKAILDLVKARLLNDKSLLPKPMETLQRTSYSKSAECQSSFARQPSHAPDQGGVRPNTNNIEANSPARPRTPVGAPPATEMKNKTSPTVKEDPLPDRSEFKRDSTGSSMIKVSMVSVSTSATSEQNAVTTKAANAAPVIVTRPMATRGINSSNASVVAKRNSANSIAADAASQLSPGSNLKAQSRETAQNWLQKSNSYLEKKDWTKAIDAATTAIAFDAGLVDSYIARSWAYAEEGQTQKAMDDITVAMNLDPNNALVYNNEAYVYEKNNKLNKAQENYQKACDLSYQPACVTVQKLKQVVKQERQPEVDHLIELSYQQFQRKDWKGVIQTTTQMLELDPENTAALANRAGAYTELGLYDRALDDCNNALIIDADMGVAYSNKGYTLERMQQPQKAALEYETACVLGVKQSCKDFKRLSHKVSSR